MGDPSPLILINNTSIIGKCLGKVAFGAIHGGLNVHT
jgi:hypothetical protein